MQQQETSSTERATDVRGLVNELKDQVGDQAQGLAEQARGAAETGKERLVEGATGVAQALRHASEGLRADDQATVGDYTDALASKVDGVARFLQSRDLPTMAKEVKEFARRQPALFLGGAFTLGIVAARFLKSSGDPRGPSTSASSRVRSSPSHRPEQALAEPAGDYGPAPGDYTSSLSGTSEADQQHPDPSVTSPGGVPPLPSGQGGGL